MAVCPKCSYSLVLLEKRRRYKCAKCGGIYLQRSIEDREFQRWNEKQREFSREGLDQDFEQLWKAYQTLNLPERKPSRPRSRLSEEEKKQRCKEYYQKNREGILKHTKEYYQKNKEKVFEKSRAWAQNNLEKARKISLKYYYRNKKRLDAKRKKRYTLTKVLALQASENSAYKPQEGNSSSQMADFYLFNYCAVLHCVALEVVKA